MPLVGLPSIEASPALALMDLGKQRALWARGPGIPRGQHAQEHLFAQRLCA